MVRGGLVGAGVVGGAVGAGVGGGCVTVVDGFGLVVVVARTVVGVVPLARAVVVVARPTEVVETWPATVFTGTELSLTAMPDVVVSPVPDSAVASSDEADVATEVLVMLSALGGGLRVLAWESEPELQATVRTARVPTRRVVLRISEGIAQPVISGSVRNSATKSWRSVWAEAAKRAALKSGHGELFLRCASLRPPHRSRFFIYH